ncbi:ATPase AAA+ type core [Neofusicoccum parvum]|uniref:Putative aaa family protein n=1 Tax=Botryosphaeria parva (strain UCR-NP2) TaxID=1287680 RepID=R1E7H5_BOTPV|nr:putative aaa family protein [Neofusicoccum parvum UCRNP2]GME66242.1 ATPase AAA+ type core [Neofusicoccum parvum]
MAQQGAFIDKEIENIMEQMAQSASPKVANGKPGEAKPAKQYLPAGTLARIRDLYQTKPDSNGNRSWTTAYPDDLEEPPENADAAQYALLVRHTKCYDGRRKLRVASMVIQSTLLKKVLGKVFDKYPGVTASLERLEFSAPFKPFVHRWERLIEARANETDPETKEHLELLWAVLEEELRDTISEKRDLLSNGVITYQAVWTIFEPGVLVYSNEDGVDRAYALSGGSYACQPPHFDLNVRYIDWDGEEFGYVSNCLEIPAFGGTCPITSLPVFPLHYHPELKQMKKSLTVRGRLFEAYKGYSFRAYEGVCIGYGPWGPTRFSVNSRVIIDTYAFNRFNPNRKVRISRIKASDMQPLGYSSDEFDTDYDDYSDDDSDDERGLTKPPPVPEQSADAGLTDDQLLICSDALRGYSLKDKKWMKFPIGGVKEIEWNEQAFDSLVAPPEQKDLILAFAQTQAMNKDSFDDVISGKGRGIIMLLSGPPGVGKTLTAESVAEVMKVPLFVMSAGDLGTEPSEVESALSNILEMNTKWNAILLLDEADVFLEARSAHDLERNKLVSIFLRLLEYYEGILFLTTNRVENIDAAFESRIHLSLQYEDLDFDSRRHVWATFLARAASAAPFTDEELDRLAHRSMNGRQIKNVLKTAQLLATKKEAPLCFAHVDTVLKLREANALLKNGLTNGKA